MGDKWTTSGGWRLKSKQSRTFAARTSQKKHAPTGSSMMIAVATNTKNINIPIRPLLRKRNGGVQGGYSAYADPIARRAIAVSSDQQHDNSSHPHHPIHPSRLQSNIQRRIRDPSQRNEIIAHYNSDVRSSWEHKRGWQHAVYDSVPHFPPAFEAYVPSHTERLSPQQVNSLPALPHSQPCRDLYMQPLETNMKWDISHDSHINNALYDITMQTNNNSRRNLWNEPSNDGIPQFQHNRKVTPNMSSPMNSFFAPSSGYVEHLPFVHHSPTQWQILPFDNFTSPSEKQKSDSHFGSMHDDLHVEADFFHLQGIPLKQSNPLTFDEPSQHHPYNSNHCLHPFGEYGIFATQKIHKSHNSSSMAPSSFHQDLQEPIETFTLVPTSTYAPAHRGVPTVQDSEHAIVTETNNLIPPFRDHRIPRHGTILYQDVTNASDRFHNHHEKPASMTNNARTDTNLKVPANVRTEIGRTSHSFGLLPESRSEMSLSPDHIEYPIVRHPQPFTVQNQIRFFNEGLEVDLNNRPLSRQSSSVESIFKVDMAASSQHNESDSTDDFDLNGKTSLWGEK